jgi:replicative DNA helicase
MLRLAIRKHDVRLFIVDFVQIVGSNGKDLREQISKASDQLTAVAKGEGVHLMLLSQLSRRSKQEYNRQPRLSDLKESGSLEQNAHAVVMIHRPWDEENGKLHCEPASPNGPGCEIIIAKQREGGTSSFPVTFDEKSLKFVG